MIYENMRNENSVDVRHQNLARNPPANRPLSHLGHAGTTSRVGVLAYVDVNVTVGRLAVRYFKI